MGLFASKAQHALKIMLGASTACPEKMILQKMILHSVAAPTCIATARRATRASPIAYVCANCYALRTPKFF